VPSYGTLCRTRGSSSASLTSGPRSMMWTRHGKAEVEWQGRHGTIVELRLLDTNGAPEMITHAQELAARYCVPVHAD
jgi:hypothetical protein